MNRQKGHAPRVRHVSRAHPYEMFSHHQDWPLAAAELDGLMGSRVHVEDMVLGLYERSAVAEP